MKLMNYGQRRSASLGETILRFLLLAVSIALILSGFLPLLSKAFADAPDLVQVKLDA